ncbi:hypothetical protein [Caldimonas brevitalea]|uniref:hypothetical protein n=1 Tax=Caldimonas brevitalea TaxID=413882 RepID=UPI0012F8B04B|nr:hypothetical protein [Caldimonas brevitalea]
MLLLKAAAPWLAAEAARWHGRQLVELCTAFGVKTVSLDRLAAGPSTASAQHDSNAPAPAEADVSCALSTLVGSGPLGSTPPATTTVFSSERVPLSRPPALPIAPDRHALWAARLRHAPPPHLG